MRAVYRKKWNRCNARVLAIRLFWRVMFARVKGESRPRFAAPEKPINVLPLKPIPARFEVPCEREPPLVSDRRHDLPISAQRGPMAFPEAIRRRLVGD